MKPWLHLSDEQHGIQVYDTTELYGETGRFRVLQFSGDAIQGALDLDHPRRVVFEYPRAMIHLMEAGEPFFEDVFVIGHGIGTIAGYFAEKRFKIAEVSAEVVELSRQHFGYSQDNVIVGDGRSILEGEPEHCYDYILLDAFTADGTPRHLISSGFFALARSRLNSRGSIIMNLMGRSEKDRLMGAIHTTLSEAFPYIKAFALPSEGTADIRNIIIMGSGRPIRYQARQMAGFVEITLGQGHVIRD
ncbi:spermidine synthase [Paenibacillus riograndensis]|uniref:Spermidine synthase n=1 Tax=Paenibacillus riograndensis SBR5 TaxID=1073571 RepID=A0A0E4CUT8_9BACL|nr:fused MFS/spermidine synthase [Paenibacillus riograndensis]CQR52813.1 spermidine synthase [Paenibacillus riograndensis SBR5]